MLVQVPDRTVMARRSEAGIANCEGMLGVLAQALVPSAPLTFAIAGRAKMRRCSASCHQATTARMAILFDGTQRYIMEVLDRKHCCRIGQSKATKDHYRLQTSNFYDERTESSSSVEVREMSH